MSSVTAWIYAVKEIHTSVYRFQNIRRRSDSHQISRFGNRKTRNYCIQDPVHLFMCLTNCESADCVSIQIHLCNLLCMLNTDIFIDTPLIDSEKHLMFVDRIIKRIESCHLFFTSCEPSRCTLYRCLHIFPFRYTGRTFIKCHRDRRRQIRLNLHTLFRSHKNLSSVNMGIEVYTLFLNLSESGKRKHLESTGISKDRLVPGHKFVQSAKLFHYLISRTHMQMISIRQFHLCSDFFKICSRNSPFDRCNCSYIHKYRSLDHSVYGMEAAALGATVPFYQFIHKNNLSHKFSNDIQPVFRNLHC